MQQALFKYCAQNTGHNSEGLLKISPAYDIFLTRLFDLDDDRDDQQDNNQATGYSNDSEVCVIQCIQNTGLSPL